jgi:hypothetical protein
MTPNLVEKWLMYQDGEVTELWTSTDGQGNYPLANDGAVFWADKMDNPCLMTLDGKPHCQKPKLWLMRKAAGDSVWALWDDNLQLVSGSWITVEQAVRDIKDQDVVVEGVWQGYDERHDSWYQRETRWMRG